MNLLCIHSHCTERFLFYCNLHTPKMFPLKGFVQDGVKTLQEIKYLSDKLHERDEKVEHISVWLQGNMEELRHLATVDTPGE